MKTELESNRKRGNHRDVHLLVDILTYLFWARMVADRCGEDIMCGLKSKHGKMKPDTLSDNLEFLQNLGTPPFIKKTSEKDGIVVYTDTLANTSREVTSHWQITKKGGRPRNIYSLDDYYIRDYFSKEMRMGYSLSAGFE